MFVFRALLICLLACSTASAEIRQTADLEIIKREIFASPKDTLVVFDTDFVLITPSDDAFILSVTNEDKMLSIKNMRTYGQDYHQMK